MAFQFNTQSVGTSSMLTGSNYLPPSESNDYTIIGMNDTPLEFNIHKNKPLTRSLDDKREASLSPTDKRERCPIHDHRDWDRRDDKPKDDSDSNMSNSQDVILPNGPNLTSNMWGGMMNMGFPMVGMNMIVDPNMMSMNNYGIMQSMIPPDPNMIAGDTGILINPIKEIIHCKSCTLFPPNPNAPLPTTRERPPGCRTIFVGGLPENMTEDFIREVFERCGEITTLRLSKKNFCHIRFLFEASVDAAIFLSGYRIRIGSNTDLPNTGRLHVDYAQARDDQYEWECRQRQLQREQRHRERMEEERLRPPSPPPVVHFTDHEASSVAEKLKLDETFSKAVQVLLTWLERGDCSKRNSNTFYSMIQSTNSHVRRLLSEKSQYEEELFKAKEIMKGRMQGILLQFGQIERVFLAASHKKVWDHFTKAQRKNIDLWKKQSMELKNVQLEDQRQNEHVDDEMEVSDDDEVSKKRPRFDSYADEKNNIKEENDNLRCQVEAYKNEVEVIKVDYRKEIDEKDKQLKMLQNTLQGMQQQLSETKHRHVEEDCKVKEVQNKKLSAFKTYSDKDIVTLDDSESETCESTTASEAISEAAPAVLPPLCERDAKLIGIISAFLNVHPFGAGLDYIWSYVSRLESNIKPSEIEVLMTKYPAVFKQELMGIGANIERRWLFNGFSSTTN